MLKKNILLILALIIAQVLFAEWKYPLPARIGSTGNAPGSISQSDNMRTIDNNFAGIYFSPSIYTDRNVINRIILGINRECKGTFTNFTVGSSYELEVDILVEYMDYSQASAWIGGGGALGAACGSVCTRSSLTKTLKIKYDPSYQTTETELSFFEFSGGYDVEVTVQDIRLNGSSIGSSPSPDNVYIENIIAIERLRDLDLGVPTTLTATAGTIANEEISLSINTPIPGAENYDIEWTYLDWYSGFPQTSGNTRFTFDFRNNASRITVKNENANIPIIYPKGIILFRVRANGYIFPNTDDLKSSSWFGEESGVIDFDPSSNIIVPVSPTSTVYGYYVVGYSSGITWQHSVSFAEEGKRKQVISYFDGSLYNRQSVTRNNSDNKAIVGQTIYDFNGRPAVQLLPTPVPSINPLDQNLSFKPNFNQTNQSSRTGKTYNYLDFDTDALNCADSKTSTLNNTSGAEQYYSANNPFTDAILRDRIPKADGYVFTQTEYMPDNTGRVRRQGGVGEAHRLTGENEAGNQVEGKETKYYYGIPNQTELNRMFASEAGDANRYKKNIVIDPNGQVSISYLDPMGRVVATSLAGNPNNSANMAPVAGRNAVTTSIDISLRNDKNFTDLKITSEYDQFVVNDNSTYDFSYRVAIPMLNYQCGATTFCYDCVYDVKLSIVDECGTELVPLNYRNNKVGINPPVEHECGVDSIVFDDASSFQLTLNQGSYKIKKVVSIDQNALSDYIDNLLASPNISDCITSYDDLVTQEKAKLDYTNCNYTCEKCTTDAQTLLTAQEITQQEYDNMIDACSIFCNQTIPCDALFQQMVIDMSRGGQYFENLKTEPISPAATSDYEDKIKNNEVEEFLTETNGSEKKDNTWLTAAWTAHTGNPSAKYWISSSGFFGASGTLTTILNQTGVVINTWNDVRKYWIDEFGSELAKLHPEYQAYILCNGIRSSYHYNDKLSNTKTAAEAITKGYYNPTQIAGAPFTNAVEEDPFFVQYPSLKTRTDYGINQALTNYKVDFDKDGNGGDPPVTYDIWEFVDFWLEEQGSDIQGCLTDYGWTMFRAGYLAEKQKIINLFYSGNTATIIDPGFKRRFYHEDTHNDDDFENAFTQSLPPSGSNEATYNSFTKTEVEEHCETTCNAYIDQWKRELAGCNLSSGDMDAVIAKLLEVCKAGCDTYDPLGSRYAKPGTTPSVRSFREALGTHFSAGVCDDLLIQWPKGSYQDMWAELNPYANRCTCLPGQQAPTPANTCATCGESLTYAGRRLKENLELADKEKCKNCITCVNLAQGLRELDRRYNTAFTPDDANKRIIMENYFNLKFSFNLTYLEYIDFMRDCAGDALITESTVANFRVDMKEYIDPDPITRSTFIWEPSNFLEPRYAISNPFIKGKGPQLSTKAIDIPVEVASTKTSIKTTKPSFNYTVNGNTNKTKRVTTKKSLTTTYKELDKCGCDLLLSFEEAYNATSPPDPCASGKTFEQYVNSCISGAGTCEGGWAGLDIDLLLTTCKNAIAKDGDNPYQTGGMTWNFIQLNNLEDMVGDDVNLIMPEDCGCTQPNDGPFPAVDPCPSASPLEYEYIDQDCDQCTMDALSEYLDILLNCIGGQFTLVDDNGVTQNVTKGELYNFLTEPRTSVISAVSGTASCPVIKLVHVTHDCAFMLHEQHLGELSRSNIFTDDCWDFRAYYERYARANGCTPPEYVFPDPVCPDPDNPDCDDPCPDPSNPDCDPQPIPKPFTIPAWPGIDPPQFCNTCYKPITANHTAILDFMNDLKEPSNPNDITADNLLTASGWDVDAKANNYLDPILYNLACSTDLKYKILGWTNNKPATTPASVPSIFFEIKDASGGGGCTHVSRWTLTFPEYKPEYKFGNIIEFTEIRPIARQNCETNNQRYLIAAKIYDPVSQQNITVKYLIGTVTTLQLWEEDPLVCKTLCNKPILPKVEATDPCTEFLDRVAESNAAILYEQQIKDLRTEFTNQYIQKCMSVNDYFLMDYELDEYHYTLYYYDQADNLIKTVPPKGVKLLSQSSIDSVYQHPIDPINIPRIKPNHNYITNYKYNTLNQLIEQTTPDAGTSKFWYDILGRIVLSQNAKQAAYNGPSNEKKFSYTLYDNLGRITEAGEIELAAATAADVSPENTATISWVKTNIEQASTKTQITRTYYDASPPWQTSLSIPNFTPTNLRNRVVVTCYYEDYPTNPDDYSHATHYSYDILGNVYHVVQDFPELEPMGQRYKNIKYNYDLASGNVNLVSYQPGEIDQFYHYYTYDADNRITQVRTARHPAINEINMAISTPNFNPEMGWQSDAKYFYYLHGPLARTELGNHKVQGIDYSYTIHGWLKAVNDGFMQNAHDPGLDGHIPSLAGTNPNQDNGRDAIGFELGYYSSNAAYSWKDYDAIGNNGHISTKTGSNYKDATVSLYNGNISQMVTTLAGKTQLSTNNAIIASTRGGIYYYDQLNRIKESQSFTNANIANYEWNNNMTPGDIPQEWLTSYSYDAMGNITALKRQDGTGGDMDDLTYHYDGATPSWKNQLLYVDDSKATGLHTEDIDDQSAGNYTYDDIGNLISDAAEEILDIEWTVYGKIRSITRTGASTKPNLEFEYNTVGQRVIKRVVPNNSDKPVTTFYLHDASGNIMATYKQYIEDIANPDIVEERLVIEEWNLYGSSRLGAYSKEELVASRIGVWSGGTFIPGDPPTYTINSVPAANLVFDEQVGFKNYELSNHLGNVLATVTDRKVPSINGTSYDYFNAQITSIADYYPFGMQIEERSWTAPSNKYRFGFNGQEKENDISVNDGGHISYKYRIQDVRLGRFLSVDPLAASYPWNSTYAFAENRVIDGIDLEGLEYVPAPVQKWGYSMEVKMSNFLDNAASVGRGMARTGYSLLGSLSFPNGELNVSPNGILTNSNGVELRNPWNTISGLPDIDDIYSNIKHTYQYGSLEDRTSMSLNLAINVVMIGFSSKKILFPARRASFPSKNDIKTVYHNTTEQSVGPIKKGINTKIGLRWWRGSRYDQGWYTSIDFKTAIAEGKGSYTMKYSVDFSTSKLMDTRPYSFLNTRLGGVVSSYSSKALGFDGLLSKSVKTGKTNITYYNNKKVNSVFKLESISKKPISSKY